MKYVELFCGCGGLAEGLRQAGWECMLAVDNDASALGLYAANFPDHPRLQHDLNDPLPADDVTPEMRHQLQHGGVLAGGSPCQDFALTCTPGKRQKGERAQLTRAFAKHVADLRPTWVLFENVKYSAHRTQFLEFVEDLKALGYVSEHRILSLRDLGMAQPRYRLILIAHATAAIEVKRVWAKIESKFSERPPVKTMRQTFADYGAPMYGKNHVYYPIPRALAVQPSVFCLDDRGERRALFTVRGRTRPMPDTYQFREKDSTHTRDDIVAIETIHLMALQGFPQGFKLHGSKGRQDQAIGNAVPPPLARVVGESMLSCSTCTTN